MRLFLHALAATWLIAGPASAQSSGAPGISAEIAQTGLAATEARLAALPAPSDAERFALGGVGFLRAVEMSLQTRWQTGMNASYMDLPVLRLPIPPNPAPRPFAPETLSTMFSDIAGQMQTARDALAPIPETSDFGLEIALDDLWFDINANGTRDQGETLAAVAGGALLGARGFGGSGIDATGLPVIRFDVADTSWLTAYTHFLSGFSEIVLAYDPTEATRKMQDAARGLAAISEGGQMRNALDNQFGFFVDRAAILLSALKDTPDPDHAAAAHGHFLAMIAHNRDFWRIAALETDDDREWLPNPRQRSALGLDMPPETGAVWLDVLADAEALLNGEKLIPYWRMSNSAGLNLKRMFLEPSPVDIVDWVQGAGALPYAERGEPVTSESWASFARMFQGEALLFVVFLN